jgi:hypothetical protein
MATETLEKETVEDEELEPQEEEKPEEESAEEEESEETQDEELEGVEEFEDEGEYFESLGIGKKTGEEVAEEVKRLREENESLKQYRAETGFEKPKFTPEPKRTDEHKFLTDKGRATKYIETLRFNEDDAGKRSKQSYSVMAQLVDSAVDPIIDEAEQGMQALRGAVAQMADHLINQSYKGFSRKDLVRLEDIKQEMFDAFDFDADKFAKKYLFERKPDLLAELTRKAEKKGEEKGREKKLRRFSSTRRSKPSPKASVDWKPYFTMGEPNDKFDQLPTPKKIKVAEAYQKAAQAAAEG